MADNPLTAATHKCKGCDRQIRGSFTHCLICKSKLKKARVCRWCGERPEIGREAAAKKPGELDYQICAACQSIVTAVFQKIEADKGHYVESTPGKYRSQDHKENTYETKHG